jgi:formylglycine-generating enzyme required for sulfatase activity
MHGNVWQWCADLDDPKAGASYRVSRGGGWGGHGGNCRAAYRLASSPSLRDFYLGLRLARVPSAQAGK